MGTNHTGEEAVREDRMKEKSYSEEEVGKFYTETDDLIKKSRGFLVVAIAQNGDIGRIHCYHDMNPAERVGLMTYAQDVISQLLEEEMGDE